MVHSKNLGKTCGKVAYEQQVHTHNNILPEKCVNNTLHTVEEVKI